jgi:hypothetical protein
MRRAQAVGPQTIWQRQNRRNAIRQSLGSPSDNEGTRSTFLASDSHSHEMIRFRSSTPVAPPSAKAATCCVFSVAANQRGCFSDSTFFDDDASTTYSFLRSDAIHARLISSAGALAGRGSGRKPCLTRQSRRLCLEASSVDRGGRIAPDGVPEHPSGTIVRFHVSNMKA